jgi:hypothetical protein
VARRSTPRHNVRDGSKLGCDRPSFRCLSDPEHLISTNIFAPIITGDEDDAWIQPSLFLKGTMPPSGLEVFAKTGDILNIEEPALFNETLAHFLVLAEAGGWPPRNFHSETPAHSALLSRPFRPLPCARGRI